MPKNQGTEQPTARKLEKARKEGMVARSPDLASWSVILAFSFALPAIFHALSAKIVSFGVLAFTSGATSVVTDLRRLDTGLVTAAELIALAGIPFVVMAVLVNFAQVGLRLVPTKLAPKLNHLSPGRNVKRIFSSGPAVETLKGIVKLLVVILVGYLVITSSIGAMTAGSLSPVEVASVTAGSAMELVRATSVVGLAIALIDFGRSRKQHRKQLLMTHQEVKDESREMEGDSHVKSRRRRVALEFSRRRMMVDVAKADVVVVNPTHYAVALGYDATRDRAPRVLAKGADYLAASIRAQAEKNGVPVVVDPPLARAVHRAAAVGEYIPASLFLVVARLLAFVYQLSLTARYYETHHETDRSELPEELQDLAATP